MEANFTGGWNQEEGKYPGLVLSIKGYVITYANYPTIWASRIQTDISLSTTEAEYIALSQSMRGVLHFVSLMKEIYFILELQGDSSKVLCTIFENPDTVHGDNQGAIALVVALQMRHRTKHTKIKYQHFWIFVATGDVEVQYIDIKE